MCGKGSNSTSQTQSSTTSANPAAMQQYNWLLGQGRNLVENTGWNPNTAQQVAGFSNDQNQAFSNIQGGIAQPYVNAATGMTMTGAGPASQGMSQYYNPWNNDVVDATIRDFGVQNNRQMSGVTGDMRRAGSLGGDREQVAKALTAEAQSRTQSPVLANLRAQGFNTALGAAQNDAARSLQGAGIMGNLGNLAYTDTQALLSSGAMQQALEQQRLDAASGNASAQSAYPFQSLGWFANLASGIGSQMGSTTTSTGSRQGPTPNTWSQLAGLGIAAMPYLNTGGRVAYAGGGGIGYIPQIQIQRGAGVHPHQQMQMGGGASQKGLADHWKDVTDTAKAGSQAFKGVSKVGEAMRTEQAPNGWGTVTTNYADPVQNLSYGLSNTMSGIGSALGFADGGAIDDNDPGGMYDAAPGGVGLVPPPRPGVFPDVSQYPPLMQPGTSVGIANAPSDRPPSDLAPMVDVADKAMIPTAGEAYAPPADMRVGALNPRGIVAPPSAPTASAAPQPQGFFDRAVNWVRSPEGEQTLTRAGLAMMAASGEGGKGTTGIHFGKGMMAGLDARDSYRKGEREQALQKAKMDLAQRAANIQGEENQRAAAMHPYEVALKQAQAKSVLSQATQREDPTQTYRIREREAERLGMDKTSNEYREFVLTGKIGKQDLSATAQKQILESEESLSNIPRARSVIKEAIELNKKAYEGILGRAYAELDANLPAGMRAQGAQATRDLERIMLSQVLSKLKDTFGAAPTEGERRILVDLETAMTKTAKDREGILNRALAEIDGREKTNRRTLDMLRGGTMFKPQASPPVGSPPPAAASSDPLGLRQ